jgi:hypothetical protein
MQLPLSASALVMLGVAAVLVGASILVVLAVRRRKPSSRPTRIPPDMRMPQQHAATPGRYAATPPVDDSARPAVPEPVSVPAQQESEPAAPPVPQQPVAQPPVRQPLAEPVPAATPRPVEVSSRVDPPEPAEQFHVDPTPSGELAAVPSRHHQAGSGRTVAAAVAQAFAVRAAAGRGSAQRPDDPPADDGAPPQPDPGPVPAEAADDVDPAATTDPDGLGLAATAGSGPEEAPAAEPDAVVSDDGWAPVPAFEPNGSHGPEGNGTPPPESWGAPAPEVDGSAPDVAAGAVLPDPGWAAQAQPVPEPATAPATVPAPRSDNDDPGRQADPRDRLLAVLLDDPDRAVGAMVELESCLSELDRLSDAVRAGRAALRDVLHRLAAAGLRPDQLARLAGLPQAEVQELLEAAPAEQQAWS